MQRVIADFEAAMWQIVQTVMPCVDMPGCMFHCRVSGPVAPDTECGLQMAYNIDIEPFRHCCWWWQLMALPFLPKEAIADTFEELVAKLTPTPRINCDYVRDIWLT